MKSQDPYILANPPLLQPAHGTKTYEVSLRTKITGLEKPIDTSTTYILEIEYSGHFFEFKKSNLKIDNKATKKKIDDLYIVAAAPLSHIKFSCTPKGQIERLHNYKHVLKSWERSKTIIEHEFNGTPTARFIKLMDRKYNNKGMLIQQLSNDFVLNTFYRSFLNDYLIYYGKSVGVFTNSNLIGTIPLALSIKKSLRLEEDHLVLESQATLNKEKTNIKALEAYFTSKGLSFNKDALEVVAEDHSLLDYKSVWIQKTKSVQTVVTDTYKKEITITLISI
ncbi:hypothetical protein ACFFU9_13355 [Mariniflexile ostreae]|uniref:Uncharacterized protein n=1 Tax=Mariniflexile ostreae TaxID=1520892 RepID=A0ABV5FF72_9FLAO